MGKKTVKEEYKQMFFSDEFVLTEETLFLKTVKELQLKINKQNRSLHGKASDAAKRLSRIEELLGITDDTFSRA